MGLYRRSLIFDDLVSYYTYNCILCPGGGIGRHKGFKIPRRQLRAGSSPALGTNILMYQKKFMKAALEEAKISALLDEVPVGCVITLDNEIISTGGNKSRSKNSPVRHAEIEAIESACSYLDNYRLLNTSLYVTLEPCHMCSMAIVNARIENLYFGAKEPKTGAVVSVDNFLDKKFLNHKVNYIGGYMERESSELLKDFFATRRKN